MAVSFLSGCGGNAAKLGTVARVAFLSGRTGNLDIWVVNSANGAFNVTNDPVSDDAFSWSPNGNKLAFLSDRDGDWEWSPAGNMTAFEYNGDICVYNLTTNGAQNLTMGNGNNMMPCWSPSGTQIVFASDRGGNWDIWIMDANGANVTQLTNDPQDEFRPVWSPNGQKIAFERAAMCG